MQQHVLFIKNITSEGPGTIADHLERDKIPYKIIDLYRGDKLPADFEKIKAVVVLGGPMNVYDEAEYPFLKDETLFIQKLIQKNIPYFGICLGAQLLAKAAGARVYKAGEEERGWFKIEITPKGKSDLLFNGLADQLEIFQWHGDTFDLPSNGVLLAQGNPVKNQAFKVGQNAYGFQFHVEINEQIIADWCKDSPHKEQYLERYREIKNAYQAKASEIYCRFF